MNTDTMTMTASTEQTTRLTVLDEALELGLLPHMLKGSAESDVRVGTTLTITGTPDEGRHGFAELTFHAEHVIEASKVSMDAGQARQLAAYLLDVADELDTRAS